MLQIFRSVVFVALAVAIGLVVCPKEVSAQQEKGDVELQFQGAGIIPGQRPSNSSGNFAVKLGKFFTNRQEVGFLTNTTFSGVTTPGSSSIVSCPNAAAKECTGRRAGTQVIHTTPDTTGLSVTAGGGAFYSYNFTGTGKTVPYIAGELFIQDFKSAKDSTLAAPSLGLKYFFKRNAALDLNGAYGFVVNNPSSGIILIRYGISFIF